jgi:hypothetical protein
MKNTTYKFLSSIIFLVITGCSGSLYLTDKNNKQDVVTYNSFTKTMEVVHNGELFKGDYVTDGRTGYGNTYTYGNKPGYGNTQVYVPGRNGRSLLISQTGEKLSCQLTFEMKLIGTCESSKGERFDLTSNSLFFN